MRVLVAMPMLVLLAMLALLRGAGAGAGAGASPACTAAIRHCAYCSVAESDEVPLKQCTRCKHACYCSPEHQKEHWKAGHKQECVRTTRTESILKRVAAVYQEGNHSMADVVNLLVGDGYVCSTGGSNTDER